MTQLNATLYYYLNNPITWYFFALGAIVGSFLNVCIIRIPEKTFFKHHRSACPHCQKTIPIWLNIPIFSWLILRGKSRCCGKKISVQYPIVEFVAAVLMVVAYWKAPFIHLNSSHSVLDPINFIRFFHLAAFTNLLLVCSVIDIHHQIIPDVISLPMIAASPLIFYVHPELDWLSSLLGVFLGGGILYLLAWLYYLVRKESGMGMGDVKLLAAIGGWLGYQSVFPTMFIGSITGALFGLGAMVVTRSISMRTAIPFGPFLSFGAWLHLFFGNEIAMILGLIPEA